MCEAGWHCPVAGPGGTDPRHLICSAYGAEAAAGDVQHTVMGQACTCAFNTAVHHLQLGGAQLLQSLDAARQGLRAHMQCACTDHRQSWVCWRCCCMRATLAPTPGCACLPSPLKSTRTVVRPQGRIPAVSTGARLQMRAAWSRMCMHSWRRCQLPYRSGPRRGIMCAVRGRRAL